MPLFDADAVLELVELPDPETVPPVAFALPPVAMDVEEPPVAVEDEFDFAVDAEVEVDCDEEF